MKITGFDKRWVVPAMSDADELPEPCWWVIGPDGEPLFPVRSWWVTGPDGEVLGKLRCKFDREEVAEFLNSE